MIENDKVYAKAYVEVNEIIKHLPDEERNKIPVTLKNNIASQMDKSYYFQFDEDKHLYEQEVLPETKALIIAIYQQYFMKDTEKKLWNKYDRICNKMIEEEKSKNYDISSIFQKKHQDSVEEKKELVVATNISFIKKIKNKIWQIFSRLKNNN